MEVDIVPSSKKRLPSGSPEGKNWDPCSGGDGEEDGESEFNLNDSEQSKKEWKLEKRGKKPRLPTKRELKRARRMEKAKLNKLEVERLATEAKAKETQAQAQIEIQAQIQA